MYKVTTCENMGFSNFFENYYFHMPTRHLLNLVQRSSMDGDYFSEVNNGHSTNEMDECDCGIVGMNV